MAKTFYVRDSLFKAFVEQGLGYIATLNKATVSTEQCSCVPNAACFRGYKIEIKEDSSGKIDTYLRDIAKTNPGSVIVVG